MPRILPNPSRTSTAMPEQSYDDWLREKVSMSLEDPRPSIPHETVMKRLRAMLVTMEAVHAREQYPGIDPPGQARRA